MLTIEKVDCLCNRLRIAPRSMPVSLRRGPIPRLASGLPNPVAFANALPSGMYVSRAAISCQALSRPGCFAKRKRPRAVGTAGWRAARATLGWLPGGVSWPDYRPGKRGVGRLFCGMCRFALPNGPYRMPKRPVPHPQTAAFAVAWPTALSARVPANIRGSSAGALWALMNGSV